MAGLVGLSCYISMCKACAKHVFRAFHASDAFANTMHCTAWRTFQGLVPRSSGRSLSLSRHLSLSQGLVRRSWGLGRPRGTGSVGVSVGEGAVCALAFALCT